MLDPYEVLGVERDASDKEIGAAAKRHAKANHPDNPDKSGDREAFEAGRRALVVLKDPKKRAQFDRTGKIDEEAVGNDMAAAMQIVIQEFAALINHFFSKEGQPDQAMFDPRKIQVFERMKFALGSKVAAGEKSVTRAQRQVDVLRDITARISTKKVEGMPATDFVTRALENQIRRFLQDIEDTKDAQRKHRLAIDLLAIYSFRADPATMPITVSVQLW